MVNMMVVLYRLLIIRLAPEDKIIDEFKILKLANDSKLQQIPDTTRKENEKYREILYITGASGSGKSYYTKSYIKGISKVQKI
jgi:predicted AAA+ superfamily ATPase